MGWTGDFAEKHPEARIDISAGGAGKGMTDVLNDMVDFAMLSRELHNEEREKGAVAFAVGRDAVIPVLNMENPLLLWSEEDVKDYIRAHAVPYNPLHDKGFPSIGCQPCTRAVQPGEDVRAGRWWWEDPDKRECGLHVRGQED